MAVFAQPNRYVFNQLESKLKAEIVVPQKVGFDVRILFILRERCLFSQRLRFLLSCEGVVVATHVE